MKLKLPKFSKIFARRKKKLRLSTARRASASGAEFDEMSEPNMKLSRALLIVLLLHIVAVGGIIAFNAIKSRQGSIDPPVHSARSQPSPVAGAAVAAIADRGRASTLPTHAPAPKAEKKSTPKGTKFYTVAKGDTPVTIAKKFKVPYDDLLAANHIDDPRKLRIGQKLIIPVKSSKAKKGPE
jgi:LysM repeat protein